MHSLTLIESVSNATKLRPEMQNCLIVAQDELLTCVWYTYVCVHECVWIHALEVIAIVSELPKQEILT